MSTSEKSHSSTLPENGKHEMFLTPILRWIILFVFLFLSVFFFYGDFQAQKSCSNEVTDWFPDDFPETRKMYFQAQNFGSAEMIMLSWEGLLAEDPIQERLAVEFCKSPGISPDGEPLPPLVREVFTSSQFLKELNELNEKRFSRQPAPKPVEEISREKMVGWLLGRDKKQGCLIVLPSAEGSADRAAFLRKIYADTMQLTGLTHQQIHLAGCSCDSVAIDEATQESNKTLLPIFVFLCSFLLAVCLRNPILTLSVLFIAFMNQFIGTALIYYVGSHMDSISLLVSALTFVLSMESGIHLSNYYKDSVSEGGTQCAVMRALKKGFVPCVLATVTTVLGMGSLAISQVTPISNFGIYTSIALLSGTFFLFVFFGTYWENWGPFDYYLPFWRRKNRFLESQIKKGSSLQKSQGEKPDIKGTDLNSKMVGGGWFYLARFISQCHWGIILFSVLSVAIFSLLVTKIETNITLHGMLKPSNEIIVDYNYLEEHFGGLVPIQIMIRIPKNTANVKRTPLEHLHLLSILQESTSRIPGVDATVSFLNFIPPIPSLDESSGAAVSTRRLFNREMEQNKQKIIESQYFQSCPEEEIWLLSAHVCAGKNLNYEFLLQEIELNIYKTMLENGITYSISRQQIQDSPFLASVAQMAGIQGLTSRFLAQEEKLNELNSKDESSMSRQEKRELVRKRAELEMMKFRDVSVMVSGAIPLVFKAQKQLLNDLIESFLTAFILITVTMIVLQRSVIAGFIVMLPNILPSIVVFGTLAALKIKIDIGSMMTASVALGITVDGTLHLLTWFQRGIRFGYARKEAVIYAYTHCAQAMLQTAFICSFTFLVFAFSNFVPVARFAWMLCILLTVAVCADIFLTPALLLSPLGCFFVKENQTKIFKRLRWRK